MKTSSFLYVIERTRTGYSAFVPDLPGCVATGRTPAAVRRAMADAVELHLEGMREDGLRIPRASATADLIAVPMARRKAG